jgi:hypothetical protein
MTNKTPILYILMRTDMASMNPGKAVAQGSHAANQMQTRVASATQYIQDCFNEWQNQGASGFGTAICLSVDDRMMRRVMDGLAISVMAPDFALGGIVRDPTYPLRDGEVTHLIPVDTCAYLFGYKEDIGYLVSTLSLMS